jgi:hypothetical protein
MNDAFASLGNEVHLTILDARGLAVVVEILERIFVPFLQCVRAKVPSVWRGHFLHLKFKNKVSTPLSLTAEPTLRSFTEMKASIPGDNAIPSASTKAQSYGSCTKSCANMSQRFWSDHLLFRCRSREAYPDASGVTVVSEIIMLRNIDIS